MADTRLLIEVYQPTRADGKKIAEVVIVGDFQTSYRRKDNHETRLALLGLRRSQ